jgi:hypothetical protein
MFSESVYSDPCSKTGVTESDHSLLGKTVLCKFVLGKIRLREHGLLWTNPALQIATFLE